MRLERLEINGFKSFSDRSELAFDKGVTAIVGPNGCGKSNVADAITWVMGEQSAKSLRGDQMEDVIFSGSDARKPTAAAEVRLRFSGVLKTVTGPAFPETPTTTARQRQRPRERQRHTATATATAMATAHPATASGERRRPAAAIDADELIQSVAREVEVTRRLYRSGESEYLIDGQICRLRDVHDLLMDTGLGAKAYAIIEQGKIGLILSSRPTDRRQLIEEAAGVTKYKARRRAAELKLEAAQQNLTRIDDIVFEVEKQRGTLKRQAAKARRYQKLRDELRRWEKVLFARKYRQLAETIESARARLADARERESVGGGARRGSRDRPRPRAHRARRGRVARDRGARSGARARARDQPPAAADRVRPRADPDARARARRRVAAELDDARGAARAGARGARGPPRAPPPRPTPSAIARRPRWPSESDAYEAAHREIEGLEADVEAARSEVFSAINSATALRHSLEHAAAARDRVAETLSKLDVEADDVRIESERVGGRPRGGGRRPAPGAGGDRSDAHRARGARVGAGQRAHRARMARAIGARRASTSSPASRRG